MSVPNCGGSRLNEKARSTLLRGIDLAQATAMTLDALVKWAAEVPAEMPEEYAPDGGKHRLAVPEHRETA